MDTRDSPIVSGQKWTQLCLKSLVFIFFFSEIKNTDTPTIGKATPRGRKTARISFSDSHCSTEIEMIPKY